MAQTFFFFSAGMTLCTMLRKIVGLNGLLRHIHVLKSSTQVSRCHVSCISGRRQIQELHPHLETERTSETSGKNGCGNFQDAKSPAMRQQYTLSSVWERAFAVRPELHRAGNPKTKPLSSGKPKANDLRNWHMVGN